MYPAHEKLIKDIYELLIKHVDQEVAMKYSKNLAVEVFNYSLRKSKSLNINPSWECKEFCLIYGHKAYNILLHLDVDSRVSDHTLINMIKDGILTREIIEMEIYKLAPSVSEEHRNRVSMQANIQNRLKITTLHTCRVCGKNNASYEQKQVRSADEPSTIFLECLECHNKWKVN